MAIKICLDAGHYGKYNRSPVNSAYYESDMAWKLHLKLKAALEGYGIQVVTTRSSQDKDLALSSRGKCAKGCDLFLSVHSNAAGGKAQTSTDRVEVIYPVSGKCSDLASKLSETVSKTMGTKKPCGTYSRRGARGDYYGVIRGAVSVGVPGLILEHSFHDYSAGGWCPATWLLVDSNLDKLAKAEAETIASYFGVKKATSSAPVKATEPKKDSAVLAWQKAAIADGFKFPRYGADGKWGSECISVAREAVIKKRDRYAFKNLTKIVQTAVGVTADGLCGPATDKAIRAYQKKHGLTADGSVGLKTWQAILGVV